MAIAEYENKVLKRECIYGNGELVAMVEPASCFGLIRRMHRAGYAFAIHLLVCSLA